MPVSSELQNALDQAWRVRDFAYGRELIEKELLRDAGDSYLRVCHITALAFCSRFQSAQAGTARLFANISPSEKRKWAADLAAVWDELGRHDIALTLAREAIHDSNAPARVIEITANCLEHLQRLDEALEVIRGGLRSYPGHPGILLVKARVLRRGKQFDEAARVLQGLLASIQTPEETRIGAGYELGHVREAQGLHGQAFQAFCKAKLLQHRQPQSREHLIKWDKQTKELENHGNLPTREDFSRWRDETRELEGRRQRLALLVGCPRSGTTLLERVLDSHGGLAAISETHTLKSEVWVPLSYGMSINSSHAIGLPEKLRIITRPQVLAARRKYWELVPDALEAAVDDRVVLDQNPSLFSSLPIIARLFADSPILVALRDPRAIAWSCFTQHLPVNPESVAFLSLENTCRHIAARLENWIVLRSRLANPWREVRYESLVNDLAGESAGILEFLELPWNEGVLDYHNNKSNIPTPSYAQASLPIYQDSLGKWKHYEPHLHGHLPILAPAMKELGYAITR